MKKIVLLVSFFTFSLAYPYFFERTLTDMKIQNGVVTEFKVDGEAIDLNRFEAMTIGRGQHRCKTLGSVESPACEKYYQTLEDVIIFAKKYVVRNRVKYFFDSAELDILRRHRSCKDFNFTISEIDLSTLSQEKQTQIDANKKMCADISSDWTKVKNEGGSENPDVVKAGDIGIWDKAKNYFFGEKTVVPVSSSPKASGKNN